MKIKALLFMSAVLISGALSAQEICNNGIDDDGDGLIDLNDPDCACSELVAAEDLPSYIRNHSFEERGCCPLSFVGPWGPPWLDCATGWHQATVATSDYFHMCGYAPSGMPLPPPDGEGAIGFFGMHGWMEYVGTCLTWPLPAHPLIAGTTYTLSMWIAGVAVDDVHTQSVQQAQLYNTLFPDPFPLAVFGYANACVPFPVQTTDCIGDEPGWFELGQVQVQPSWDWMRVSITFTPTQDIHSIMIGSACNLPASFTGRMYTDSEGNTVELMPYFLADELLLTEAGDQVLSPTSVTGNLCAENVVATALPPTGATNYQWYLNGVALPGQTGTTLDVSAGGYGPGLYTMAMDFNGQCLMGSAAVGAEAIPTAFPAIEPAEGCAPLTVAFNDTTGGGTSTVSWNLGDGTTSNLSELVHTYSAPGTYDVALTVSNSMGCTGTTTIPDAITVHPPVSGQISVQPNPVLVDDPMVQLTGSGSANIVSWWWDLGAADPSTSADPSVSAEFPAEPGNYPVMLVITSGDGCVDTIQSVVRVINPGVIEMPNVFSPNGDGHNDRFIPIDYKGAPGVMEIYNRWGQLIFTTSNLAQGWNGRGAPDGTYYYIVTPDDPEGTKLTGHVTLVR